MSYRSGKDCKVSLGTNAVVGMGSWSISSITAEQMDTAAFNDNWKTFEFGMKDGGTIEFSGLADPDDVTGQEALELANLANTDLTNIRLYIDDTSYYEPNQTTGYYSRNNTTGNDTIKSWVNVTSFSKNVEKSGMMQVSFTAKVSGMMALV